MKTCSFCQCVINDQHPSLRIPPERDAFVRRHAQARCVPIVMRARQLLVLLESRLTSARKTEGSVRRTFHWSAMEVLLQIMHLHANEQALFDGWLSEQAELAIARGRCEAVMSQTTANA